MDTCIIENAACKNIKDNFQNNANYLFRLFNSCFQNILYRVDIELSGTWTQ